MKKIFRQATSFTLIELLAVIAIIGILSGLVLGGAGAVRQRAARGQAKAEIAAIEAGLARYQMDFGVYPVAAISISGNSYVATPTSYTTAGQALFTNLWGASNYAATTGTKQYLSTKPAMVYTNTSPNYFSDPWGYAYGYYWSGTRSQYGGAAPDVWSTGGQSGLSGQTNRLKWITSWE